MREFKVGDKVFSTTYGIMEVTEVDSGNVFTGLNPRCMFTLDGKASYKCKYQGIYHLDEALKMFPQWLEEVEEEIDVQRWFVYNSVHKTSTNIFTFDTEFLCKERILYSGSPGDIPVPFQVTEKRKIIREKQ